MVLGPLKCYEYVHFGTMMCAFLSFHATSWLPYPPCISGRAESSGITDACVFNNVPAIITSHTVCGWDLFLYLFLKQAHWSHYPLRNWKYTSSKRIILEQVIFTFTCYIFELFISTRALLNKNMMLTLVHNNLQIRFYTGISVTISHQNIMHHAISILRKTETVRLDGQTYKCTCATPSAKNFAAINHTSPQLLCGT